MARNMIIIDNKEGSSQEVQGDVFIHRTLPLNAPALFVYWHVYTFLEIIKSGKLIKAKQGAIRPGWFMVAHCSFIFHLQSLTI